MPSSDWPVGNPVGCFPDWWLVWQGLVILGCIRPQAEQASKPHSSKILLQFLLTSLYTDYICKVKQTFLSLSWFWRVYFHSNGNLTRTLYDSYINNRKPKQTTITMLEGTQCHGWEVSRGYVRDKAERSGEMALVSNEGGKWCGCPGIVIAVTEARGYGKSGGQMASVRTVVEPTQGRRRVWTM